MANYLNNNLSCFLFRLVDVEIRRYEFSLDSEECPSKPHFPVVLQRHEKTKDVKDTSPGIVKDDLPKRFNCLNKYQVLNTKGPVEPVRGLLSLIGKISGLQHDSVNRKTREFVRKLL